MNNFYNGDNQNVDTSKIQLPISLHNSVADELANLDIMAFDSFDGADFTVKADKIFDVQKDKKIWDERPIYIRQSHKTSVNVFGW